MPLLQYAGKLYANIDHIHCTTPVNCMLSSMFLAKIVNCKDSKPPTQFIMIIHNSNAYIIIRVIIIIMTIMILIIIHV